MLDVDILHVTVLGGDVLQDALHDELLTQVPGQVVLSPLLELDHLTLSSLNLPVILQDSHLNIERLRRSKVSGEICSHRPHVDGQGLVVFTEELQLRLAHVEPHVLGQDGSELPPHGGDEVGPVVEVGQQAPLVPLDGGVLQGGARPHLPCLGHLGPEHSQSVSQSGLLW